MEWEAFIRGGSDRRPVSEVRAASGATLVLPRADRDLALRVV